MEDEIIKYIEEHPGTCDGPYLVKIFGDEAHDIILKLSNEHKIKFLRGFVITDK